MPVKTPDRHRRTCGPAAVRGCGLLDWCSTDCSDRREPGRGCGLLGLRELAPSAFPETAYRREVQARLSGTFTSLNQVMTPDQRCPACGVIAVRGRKLRDGARQTKCADQRCPPSASAVPLMASLRRAPGVTRSEEPASFGKVA